MRIVMGLCGGSFELGLVLGFVLGRLAWEGHGDTGWKTYPHLLVFLLGFGGESWYGGARPGDGIVCFRGRITHARSPGHGRAPRFSHQPGKGEGGKSASGGTDGRQGKMTIKLECSKKCKVLKC